MAETASGTPGLSQHFIPSGKTDVLMISQRLLNVLFIGSLAAAIGAASGASVDTEPLRWGRDLRDHLVRGEAFAAAAIQRHENFQGANRVSRVADLDYLAEDDVIYLTPIEASLDSEDGSEPRDMRAPQTRVQSPSVEQAGLMVKAQQDPVDLILGGLGAGEQRAAATLPRSAIVYVPTPGEGSGRPHGRQAMLP
jgi:hypothetical protein